MIEIVLCTDDNYVIPTAVLMDSIGSTNANLDIHYNVISGGLSKESEETLARHKGGDHTSISFYTIDENFLKNCPIRSGEHVSIATYYRLLLPTILPQDIEKVLYMDGDIICTDSIQELWDIDLTNYAAAAAPDMRCNDIRNLNRLSLNSTDNYLNAGVMLINLKWWREKDIQNRAVEFISNNREVCLFHDQDALNVMLNGAMKVFPIRFNFQEHFLEPTANQFISRIFFDEIEKAKYNPCLIHYTGFRKPWHQECVNPLQPIWLYFYKRTEWKNDKLKFRHKGFRLFKYRLREKLSDFKLTKTTNIYKGKDFSNLVDGIIQRLH